MVTAAIYSVDVTKIFSTVHDLIIVYNILYLMTLYNLYSVL